jgi:hypothetical protein
MENIEKSDFNFPFLIYLYFLLNYIGNFILDRITGFTGLKCKENGNRVPLLQSA